MKSKEKTRRGEWENCDAETRRRGDAAQRKRLMVRQMFFYRRVSVSRLLLALEALHAITFAAREIRSLQRLKVKLRREALAARPEV
jgi:hypothetical protein